MSILTFLSALLFKQPTPSVEIVYEEVEINGETPYNRE